MIKLQNLTFEPVRPMETLALPRGIEPLFQP
jgi:hypothetical protein